MRFDGVEEGKSIGDTENDFDEELLPRASRVNFKRPSTKIPTCSCRRAKCWLSILFDEFSRFRGDASCQAREGDTRTMVIHAP